MFYVLTFVALKIVNLYGCLQVIVMLLNYCWGTMPTENAGRKQALRRYFRWDCLIVSNCLRQLYRDAWNSNYRNVFSYNDLEVFNVCVFQACRENHVSVVELLLDEGASVTASFPNSRWVINFLGMIMWYVRWDFLTFIVDTLCGLGNFVCESCLGYHKTALHTVSFCVGDSRKTFINITITKG